MDEKIVIWGQSCVGKTTMASLLTEHHYYCFDHLFRWHEIESLGLCPVQNLKHFGEYCTASKYVIDGWSLIDPDGSLMPDGSVVYVVYAPYDQIIQQYRIPVESYIQHRHMFERWYGQVPYSQMRRIRYFLNDGDFCETTPEDYITFLRRNL